MKLIEFRVRMYKSILDSGPIRVSPLTVMVGKNEAGKTSLLKALHKFNPFHPEAYSMDREWPRGYRRDRDDAHPVCTARFELTPEEIGELAALTDQKMTFTEIEVTRDYAGRLEVLFPPEIFPDKLHPNHIDEICRALPNPSDPVGEVFQREVKECLEETRRLAHEGRFSDLAQLRSQHNNSLQAALTPENPSPQHQHESEWEHYPFLAACSGWITD